MRIRCWLPLLALGLCALAHAQQTYDLKYTPGADVKWQEKLSAEIVEALAQGQAMGISGNVTTNLEMQVLSVDEADKNVTLQVAMKGIQANLNGQASQPADPEPTKFIVDQRGEMSLPKDAPEAEQLNWADTGGIPVQLLVVIAQMLRLPQQPATCGQEWTYEDKYDVPGIGELPINSRWKLADVDGDEATLTAVAAALIPDFKVPNPVAPGTQVDVKGARLNITQMTQNYDMAKSRLTDSEAIIKLDARVDMGGFEMPLVMTLKSKLEPIEE